jgi:hypothetical protein
VTVLNKAGHDAVFEAELNDKEEVVAYLLVEGEGLEEGLGGEAGGEEDSGKEEGSKEVETDEVEKKLEKMEVKEGEKLGG